MPCGVEIRSRLGFIGENLIQPLDFDARIDNGQALTQRGKRAQQDLQFDIAPRFKVDDGLAATTHLVGYPGLGAVLRLAFGSHPDAKVLSVDCGVHNVRLNGHFLLI